VSQPPVKKSKVDTTDSQADILEIAKKSSSHERRHRLFAAGQAKGFEEGAAFGRAQGLTEGMKEGAQSAASDVASLKKLASASGRGQPKNTWYFAFDPQARLPSEAGVAFQLESLAYSQYRKQALTKASIISFSSSAESPEIRGFISGKSMWPKTVQTWLTSSEISNLQLHPIADRFNDPKILSFLADSTLPVGLRLRVDTMDPSDAAKVRAGSPGMGSPGVGNRGRPADRGRPPAWPPVQPARRGRGPRGRDLSVATSTRGLERPRAWPPRRRHRPGLRHGPPESQGLPRDKIL
jgi:hypothetical protein